MGFSAKVKAFLKEKDLNNRDLSKLMDDYSEQMISNYLNSDEWKDNFIKRLLKLFPELDLNALLKDDEEMQIVSDIKEVYKTKNLLIVEDLEAKIKELKENLSR